MRLRQLTPEAAVLWWAEPEDEGATYREIQRQRRPRDPAEPRSRWERVRLEGQVVEVEVERLAPPGEEEA